MYMDFVSFRFRGFTHVLFGTSNEQTVVEYLEAQATQKDYLYRYLLGKKTLLSKNEEYTHVRFTCQYANCVDVGFSVHGVLNLQFARVL